MEGTIYGGGQRFETYEDMAKLIGNVNIDVESDTLTMNKNLYGGGNAGDIDGDITLNVANSTVGESVYGGGEAGHVSGNSDITISSTNITGTIYGGGFSGNVGGKTTLDIDNTTATEVYGGGYSGTVGAMLKAGRASDPDELIVIEESAAMEMAASRVTVKSGMFDNIFGGGNLGQIVGSSYVEVGSDCETSATVNGVVYGGGRGVNADAETITGESRVFIEEKGTNVENYGSTKLGKVVGKVYLTFKNYYQDNPVSKYKRMNGIDRATTVTFNNSYVLLENMVDGELKGIEAIKNIILPSGSGLKISADGEITGDFVGGGELYLDSEVCLTVQGDISNKTTLRLNPKNQTIHESIENPYMWGDSEATNTEEEAERLVSGEDLYTIYTQKSDLTDNKTRYYIAESITIEDYLVENSTNVTDRNYTGIIEDSNLGLML